MAITNGYITLAELKTWLGTTADTHNAQLETAIESASRWIDKKCNRYFWADDGATKYYNRLDMDIVITDDIRSITTLKTDEDGDRTYETTWAVTDYDLMPFQQQNGWPYEYIERTPDGDNYFPKYNKSIQIVGNFGWASVPEDIKEACYIQASRYFLRKDSPWAVAGTTNLGEVRLIDKVDRDVMSLIESYVRITF